MTGEMIDWVNWADESKWKIIRIKRIILNYIHKFSENFAKKTSRPELWALTHKTNQNLEKYIWKIQYYFILDLKYAVNAF